MNIPLACRYLIRSEWRSQQRDRHPVMLLFGKLHQMSRQRIRKEYRLGLHLQDKEHKH